VRAHSSKLCIFLFIYICTTNQSINQIDENDSCPSASLDYIIEPWFLGPGATGPGGSEFQQWAEDSKSKYGTTFLTSVADLPNPEQPRVALISGRTADNPRLLNECIEAGCKCIYLEKPGAPTVRELEEMKECAEKAGIEVLMGYNKVRKILLDGIGVYMKGRMVFVLLCLNI